jgi:outer membrane protein TolC
MFKRTIGIIAITGFFMIAFSHAQENEKTLSLSLEDCILKAMKNNLGVAIAVMDPDLADVSISMANEKFLPEMSLNYSARDTSQASYSFLDAAEVANTVTNNYSAQITQLLPTGGNFTLNIDGYKTDSNRTGITINPRYGNELRFSFSQPLLRNFGFKMARREIIIAKNNLDISEQNLQTSLQNTVYDVEDAYWNYVYSIENLKVIQQSLDLARDLLEKNKRAVEVGTMAPIEILNAEASVATREADILQAEAQVLNNEDRLKTIINLEAEMPDADLVRIIPTDTPAYEEKDISLEEALQTAMENRSDLNAARINIQNRELNVSYSKNQLLPNLSLQAQYWSPGVTGDQLILDPNDRFGPPIGSISGNPSDALKDALGFTYKNWSIGVSLTMPASNFFSRASLIQARMDLEQSMLQLKEQEQQIFLDIKTAVRAVQTDYKRVQAYKVARELVQRQLEAEEEKFKVGLTTNYFVLEYQRDLRQSRTQELRAIVDYNLSLANLSQTMGVSLKEKGIKISEFLSY